APPSSHACFVARDHNGHQRAFVYYESEPRLRSAAKLLTHDKARRKFDGHGSKCNVKLTATVRLKPSSNARSHEGKITAYVRSKRGAMNPQTNRTIIAPTIAPMKPAPWPA